MKTVEYEFAGGGVRDYVRVDPDVECAAAIGREMTVYVGESARYSGVVSRCEHHRLAGKVVYSVWLRRGEYENGPFVVKELPDADDSR